MDYYDLVEEFKKKTVLSITSSRKELREVLQWAEEKDSPVTDKNVDDTYGSAADPIDQMSNIQELRRELHDVLLMVLNSQSMAVYSGVIAERFISKGIQRHI